MTLRLVFLFSALTTLAITHFFALTFLIYWKYLWFDIPVHILGGVCVALGVSTLPYFRINLPSRYETLLGYLVVVLAVGVIWEVFEYVAVITKLDDDFALDTMIDLLMDLFGGTLGYTISKYLKRLEM